MLLQNEMAQPDSLEQSSITSNNVRQQFSRSPADVNSFKRDVRIPQNRLSSGLDLVFTAVAAPSDH